MSKTDGTHEAVKPSVTPDPGKPIARIQTATQWLTAASFFFVVMTPVIYIMGRAYHDGWYAYLNLDQGMFPLDTPGMLAEGFVALADGLGRLLKGDGELLHHWFLLLLVVVAGGFVWALFAHLNQLLDEDRPGRKKDQAKQKVTFTRWLMWSAFPRVALLAIFGFAIYELIAATALVFLSLTQPLVALGKYEASQAAANDFKTAPVVTLKSPQGDVKLREIGCGPQFCALWGDKHASYAPVSAVSWGDAPAPIK